MLCFSSSLLSFFSWCVLCCAVCACAVALLLLVRPSLCVCVCAVALLSFSLSLLLLSFSLCVCRCACVRGCAVCLSLSTCALSGLASGLMVWCVVCASLLQCSKEMRLLLLFLCVCGAWRAAALGERLGVLSVWCCAVLACAWCCAVSLSLCVCVWCCALHWCCAVLCLSVCACCVSLCVCALLVCCVSGCAVAPSWRRRRWAAVLHCFSVVKRGS